MGSKVGMTRKLMKFSREIRAWRESVPYTQREAARVLDVPLRTYEGWESGRSAPRMLAQVAVLGRIMNLTRHYGIGIKCELSEQ